MSERKCGDCQLCCKLLPVAELSKPSGSRCKHQKHHKGCGVYATRPLECQIWQCAWLAGIDGGLLSRPDRTHYIIDVEPDLLEVPIDGRTTKLPAIVMWLDPQHHDAHKDKTLRNFLETQCSDQYVVFARYNAAGDGIALVPPILNKGKWLEIPVQSSGKDQDYAELSAAFGNAVLSYDREKQ